MLFFNFRPLLLSLSPPNWSVISEALKPELFCHVVGPSVTTDTESRGCCRCSQVSLTLGFSWSASLRLLTVNKMELG